MLPTGAMLLLALASAPVAPANAAPSPQGDPLWNGILIGAAVGAAGGLVATRASCGPNDHECDVNAGIVLVPAGVAAGALLGALVDHLHRPSRGFGRIVVAPVIGRRHRALAVSVRF